MSKQMIWVCGRCGSADVSCNATVVWDVPAQEWVVADVCDGDYGDYCGECEDETHLEQRELNEGETA